VRSGAELHAGKRQLDIKGTGEETKFAVNTNVADLEAVGTAGGLPRQVSPERGPGK
jgi:hypothetical protein